jgi:hypothetical protein
MRLTVNLDPDVARLIADAARGTGRSKTRVVNDAVRRALTGLVAPLPEPVTELIIEPRPADESDHAAVTEALSRYFGLPAPPPLLRLVPDD